MEQVVLSRHGQSVATAHGLENGAPDRDEGLTPTGREQARELGRLIAGDPIEVAVTSDFPRTKQTAELALEGRPVPFRAVRTLNDIRYGMFEGRPQHEYLEWMQTQHMAQPIPGGESRVQVVRRLCAALEMILDLPQRIGLVVTHELLLADLLAAADGETPSQVRPKIQFATPYRVDRPAIQDALELLGQWVASQEDRSREV
jgi:probable phosphoglycerate mutase